MLPHGWVGGCRQTPTMATAAARVAVLEGIRAAQERGFQHGRRSLPPFATALAEIAEGAGLRAD